MSHLAHCLEFPEDFIEEADQIQVLHEDLVEDSDQDLEAGSIERNLIVHVENNVIPNAIEEFEKNNECSGTELHELNVSSLFSDDQIECETVC